MELTQPSLIVMDILGKNTEKKYVKRIKICGKNTLKGKNLGERHGEKIR